MPHSICVAFTVCNCPAAVLYGCTQQIFGTLQVSGEMHAENQRLEHEWKAAVAAAEQARRDKETAQATSVSHRQRADAAKHDADTIKANLRATQLELERVRAELAESQLVPPSLSKYRKALLHERAMVACKSVEIERLAVYEAEALRRRKRIMSRLFQKPSEEGSVVATATAAAGHSSTGLSSSPPAGPLVGDGMAANAALLGKQ